MRVRVQGAESSRLGVIWSVLDDDKDGYITAAELEDWFRDEAFLDNRLFSPHHNGVTSIHALALSFLHSVDRDRDDRVSYDDLKAYTEGMKEEEIQDLAQSLVEVGEEKKKKACKKVFQAIDTANQSDTSRAHRGDRSTLSTAPHTSRLRCARSGYWTVEDAERFIRNEVHYQMSRGATAEQCEHGVHDMRARLLPSPTAPGAASLPLADGALSQPSSAPAPVVTFEALCAFFSTWPLREIRKHTEELVSSAMEKKRELTLQLVKQRRVSRSEVSSAGVESSSVSYSRSRFSSAGGEHEMAEEGETKDGVGHPDELHDGEPLLSVSMQPALHAAGEPISVSISPAPRTSQTLSSSSSSSLSSSASSSSGFSRPTLALSLPPAALSDLLSQMTVLHDEVSSLNAHQRALNEESRRISDRLMSVDSSRLTISTALNDIQTELTSNHQKHVTTTAARTNNEEKLKATLKRFEECAEEGHRLAREVEVCRETLVSMKTEVNDLAKASKQVPDHLKALDKSVADETPKLQAATKAHKDAQHMINMLESELSAQERALQGAGGGGGGQGQAALNRLRSKLAGYRKVEREREEEMKASSEALRKWEEEKEGDEELKRIGGKMQLYKTSLREKKEQLSQLQRDYDLQQSTQDKLDAERRAIYNDIMTQKKAEKATLTRIQQLSENYASADQQVTQLGKEKEDLVKAARALVDVQEKADQRLAEAMMEMECLCDDVVKAKEDEEEEARREELLMQQEEEAQRAELELKVANGWEPDETYVPPVPYTRPDEAVKPMLWCCPVWIDVEGRRVQGIAHVSRFMLTIENLVHPQQRREEAVRLCVDVQEIADIKLKAVDTTGQPTLTLQRMPSPIKPLSSSPTPTNGASSTASSFPPTPAGAAPAIALPVAMPVSPHRVGQRNGSLPSPNWSAAPRAPATPSSSVAASASANSSSPSPLTTASGYVSQAYEAASSLLDTVVGPVSDAVTHAAFAVAAAAASSASAATSSSSSATTSASSSFSTSIPASPKTTAASAFASLTHALPLFPSQSFALSSTAPQPFSPVLSPSSVQPSLRRTLSLAPRQISLTLRSGYRNRFLVAIDGDKSPPTATTLSHTSSSHTPSAPIQRLSLNAEELHLRTLFDVIRLNIHARRRKSFSSFALTSPPSTPHSLPTTPDSAPSTPVHRQQAVPTLAVTQSAGKAKESFAERQARKKKRREKKERELQHRRELQQASEEVYIEGVSDILSLSFIQRLVRHTPARYHLSVWRCVYSMTVHGVSFSQLLSAMAERPCGLILIKDMQGKRFGGYASNPFISNAQALNAFYGTGECWVWEVRTKTAEERAWDDRERVAQSSAQPTRSQSAMPAPSPAAVQDEVDTPPSPVLAASVGGAGGAVGDETVAVYRWSGLNDYFMFTGADPPFIAMGGGGAFAWRLDASLRFGSSGECSTYQSPAMATTKDFQAILFEVWCPVHGKF